MPRKINDDLLLSMLGKEGKNQKECAEYFNCSEAAISKRLKRILPLPDLSKLSDKRKAFVLAVAGGNNPTDAASKAFECTTRDSAKSLGSSMMKEPDIRAGIKEVMDYHGLTKSYRVGKLRKLVDNTDPNVSLKALDQTWKLEGAYCTTEVHVNIDYQEQAQKVSDLMEEYERIAGAPLHFNGATVELQELEGDKFGLPEMPEMPETQRN